jgi:Mn-containing catalase
MFLHRKETIMPLNVGKPDALRHLLEQFGGPTSALNAALQAWV